MALEKYNKKRNFLKKSTPEPKGKVVKNRHKNKNLFVIQKHAASHLHYDLRLELNGVLLSWAVPKGPCFDPSVKRLAIQTEDHPIAYGSFEGLIPKGEYGGGTVMLWDTGEWQSEDSDLAKAYEKGHLNFTLKAKKLKGRWHLVKLKNDEDNNAWFLIKGKDKYAKNQKDFDVTLEKPKSILSKLNLDQLTKKLSKPKKNAATPLKKIKINLPKKNPPSIISPQLATLIEKAPEGGNWLHEIKLDGYRIIAYMDSKKIRLMSRNNKDLTNLFPNVVLALKNLKLKKAIIDGELVILDENNKSNFQLLQNALDEEDRNHDFIYYVFDIIYYDHFDLRGLPLLSRKEILANLISSNLSPAIRYSDHVEGSGEKVFKKSCELGLEGIISKDKNSFYVGKRSKSWLKIKCIKRQELIIGGYTKPQGSRNYFGSLLLGYYDSSKKFIYCGKVGTGFTQSSLKKIHTLLKKNISKKNPFATNPPGYREAMWVKPAIVAEIEFVEWTNDGKLRHPSFKGLRIDKKLKDIKKELPVQVKNNHKRFKLTHPEKMLYPEDNITKLDLASYYDAIFDWILPYIKNRPLTLVRCPENYKACFYQKHTNNTTPNTLFEVEKNIYIKDRKGLMSLIQMNTLEIHAWGSKVDNIDCPDIITFDIDPSPEIDWKKTVLTAFRIKKHLEDFNLKSFVKTTGGKGLHVVVPISPNYNWNVVKKFAHAFVNFMNECYPNTYVVEMSKKKRKNKIFLDYLRNYKGATSISAYSTRARLNAPVSTPIAWKELTDNFEDTFFTIKTLPNRLKKLKKDPWIDFFKIKQSLKLGED